MCDYCKKEKTIFFQEVISHHAWGFGWDSETKINLIQAESNKIKMGVFIDRGYIRFCNLDDCQCMDHGEKIKIQSCPFCGKKLMKG